MTKRKIDEIVPVGSPTEIPKDQSHFGGFPRRRTQERKEEMGDNMRCLYTTVTMPRSVHCGEDCRAALPRGLSKVVTAVKLLFQPKYL